MPIKRNNKNNKNNKTFNQKFKRNINQNLNQIVVNVNNQKKNIKSKQSNQPQRINNPQPIPIPYVIRENIPPINTPVQNDFGIGFHRIIEGLNNRLSTLHEENNHLIRNSILNEERQKDFINNFNKEQKQKQEQNKIIIPIPNFEEENKNLFVETNFQEENMSTPSNYSQSSGIINLNYQENRDENNLIPNQSLFSNFILKKSSRTSPELSSAYSSLSNSQTSSPIKSSQKEESLKIPYSTEAQIGFIPPTSQINFSQKEEPLKIPNSTESQIGNKNYTRDEVEAMNNLREEYKLFQDINKELKYDNNNKKKITKKNREEGYKQLASKKQIRYIPIQPPFKV